MALWTPYAQEAALDLSRSTVKSELELTSHDVVSEGSLSPYSDYAYKHYVASPVEQCRPTRPSCHDYLYPQHAFRVSSAQVSPESVSRWSPPPTCRSSRKGNSVPSPPASPDLYDIDSLSDDVEYQAFERDALRAMAEKNGGSLLGNNPRMRRAVQTNQAADDSYRKQRERNNFAAKQSRDRRKLREVRLAFQVTFLKKKMADLRARLAAGVCVRCREVCEC